MDVILIVLLVLVGAVLVGDWYGEHRAEQNRHEEVMFGLSLKGGKDDAGKD